MREIPLRGRDGSVRAYALVDDADFERVSARRWSLMLAGRGGTYAQTWMDGRPEHLHRFVLGLERGDGQEVDHINRDGLDCRRENMRLATRALNAQNVVARRGAVSRFRGVSFFPQRGVWRARVGAKTVGYRGTELEAALLAEAYRREHCPFAEPDPMLLVALAGEAVAA